MRLRPLTHPIEVGFTFLETVVVLALIGTVLAFAVPSYLNRISNERALGAAHTLAADLHAAQQEAVTRRASVIVTFSGADPACAGNGSAASYVIMSGSSVIKRTCLAADVEWAPVPAVGLAFQSLGIPDAGMTIALRSLRSGQQYTVTVKVETGVIVDDTR